MDTTPEKNQPRILETVNKQIDLHHDEHSENLKGEDSAHEVSEQLQEEGRINKECEEGGSNNEPKANKMQAEIKNQWFTLSKPFENFKFPVNLYAKCTLNKRMNSLTFKEGDLVERLEGTCFRVGYEVFLCPRNRLSALGKKLVFFGVFVSNPFHPLSNLALLLDVGAYEVYNSTIDAKKNDSISIFRVAPIQFVAKVPGGKTYEDMVEVVDAAASLASVFLEDFATKEKSLQELDFIPLKPKVPNSVDQKMSTRSTNLARKGKVALKHSPQLGASTPKKTSAFAIDDRSKTPPFVMKLANRTASKVIEAMNKSMAASLQKEQAKSARLGAENKALKEKLTEARVEISQLKGDIKKLQAQSNNKWDPTPSQTKVSKKGMQMFVESDPSSSEPETFNARFCPTKANFRTSSSKKSSQKRYVLVNATPSPEPVFHRSTSKVMRSVPSSGWKPACSPPKEYVYVKAERRSPRLDKRKSELEYDFAIDSGYAKTHRKYA